MPWRFIFRSIFLLLTLPAALHADEPAAQHPVTRAAALARLLDSPTATMDERITACRQLVPIADSAAQAIPALIGALAVPSDLRIHARLALTAIGDPAIPSLRAAMHVAQPDAFAALAETWAAIDDAANLPRETLLDRLIHGTLVERYEAALELAATQPPAMVLTELEHARDHDDSPLVREAAGDAASRVRQSIANDPVAGAMMRPTHDILQPSDHRRLAALLKTAGAGTNAEQIAALQHLAHYGDLVAIDIAGPVRKLMDAPSADVSRAAAQTLGAMGGGSLAQWIDALKSPDGFTRRLAAESLSDPQVTNTLLNHRLRAHRDWLPIELKDLLHDPNPMVRLPAAEAYCTLGAAESVPLLKAMKEDEVVCEGVLHQLLYRPTLFDFYRNWNSRLITVAGVAVNEEAVNEQNSEFEAAIAPGLIRRLASSDPDVVQRAVAVCKLMRSKDFKRQLRECVMGSFDRQPPIVRDMIEEDLARSSSAPIPFLLMGASSSDDALRLTCVKSLADRVVALQDPRAVNALIAALSDRNPDIRKIALHWAVNLPAPPPEIAGAVAGMLTGVASLDHADEDDRILAAMIIGRIGTLPEICVPALLAALDDPRIPVQRRAAAALRSYGSAAEPGLTKLAKILDEQAWPDGLPTAQTLAGLGTRGRSAAGAFIARALAADENCFSNPAFGDLINHAGPYAAAAEPALERLLAGNDNAIRAMAANALGNIGSASYSALPALTRMVDNQNADIRSAASVALVKISPDGKDLAPALIAAVLNADGAAADRLASALRQSSDVRLLQPRLANMARDDSSDAVRKSAKRAMELLNLEPIPASATQPANPAGAQAMPADVEILAATLERAGATKAQKVQACRALQEIGAHAASAAPILAAALGDDLVRSEATGALIALGPAAIPALRRAVKIGRPEVRFAAVDAWAAIDTKDSASVDDMIARLKNGSDEERFEAATALGYYRFKSADAALEDADKNDPDCDVREAARLALASNHSLLAAVLAGRPAPIYPAVSVWSNLWHADRDPEKKAAEPGDTEMLPAHAQPSAASLRPLLDSPVAATRLAAAADLRTCGEEAVPQWADALEHSHDNDTRRLAIKALAEMPLVRFGDRAAAQKALMHAMKDPDAEIQRAATDAFWTYWPTSSSQMIAAMKAGDKDVEAALLQRLLSDPDSLPMLVQDSSNSIISHGNYFRPSADTTASVLLEKITPQLLALLESNDRAMRHRAFWALVHLPGQTASPQFRQAMTRLLEDMRDYRSADTGEMLAALGRESLPALLEAFHSKQPAVRVLCIARIAEESIGQSDDRAMPAFHEALVDPSPEIRIIALRWAGQLKAAPADVAAPLARMLKPGDTLFADSWVPRTLAVTLLVKFEVDPAIAVPALIMALDDKAAEVQSAAIRSLRFFAENAAGAVPRLAQFIDHSAQNQRDEAAETLMLLGPAGRRAATPVYVDRLVGANDAAVRLQAVRTLALIGPDAAPAVPELEKQLAGSDNDLRAAVAFALGRIGPAAVPALSGLTRMVDNRSPAVREVAAAALVRISPNGAGLAPAMIAAVNNADRACIVRLAIALRHGTDNATLLQRLSALATDDPERAVCVAARYAMESLTVDSIPVTATRPGG